MTPGLVAFLASARVRDQPARLYRWLHRVDPVHRSPFGFWVLSGHAEVAAALRHPDLGTEVDRMDTALLRIGPLRRLIGADERSAGGGAHQDGPFEEIAQHLMLFRDPPDHTRLRGLAARAFTPRRVAALADRVAAVADDLVGPLRHRARFDLMEELAYPFPAKVICELLGLPADDHVLIATHGRALAVGLDPLPSADELRAADRAVEALRAHLDPVVAARRAAPRDDLLSVLVGAADDGDRLAADELLATIVLLLIAGHETTANLIGNATVVLDRHPAARRRLAADEPGLAETAVEELLRIDPPVQLTQRIALAPVEVAPGAVVPTGAVVILLVGAANRDPAVFARPRELDLARTPNPHLTFGAGAHYCLGAALARLEGRIVLPALARALPDLRVAARPRPRHRPSITVRGYATLSVEQPTPRPVLARWVSADDH